MCISVGAEISFYCEKEDFDRCFNRLDPPVEESRPDRQGDPTNFHFWCAHTKIFAHTDYKKLEGTLVTSVVQSSLLAKYLQNT